MKKSLFLVLQVFHRHLSIVTEVTQLYKLLKYKKRTILLLLLLLFRGQQLIKYDSIINRRQHNTDNLDSKVDFICTFCI